jgi:hypothetical protein
MFLYEFTRYANPGPAPVGPVAEQWRFVGVGPDYTDENDVVWLGETITHGSISQSRENAGGELLVTVPRTNAVAAQFLHTYPISSIWLRLYNSETGLVEHSGSVRMSEWGELTATLKVADFRTMTKRQGLRLTFSASCEWHVYGPRCGVNKDAQGPIGVPPVIGYNYRNDGEVLSASEDGLTLSVSGLSSRTNGFFAGGPVYARGHKRMAISHTGNTIELTAPIPGLQAGDEVVAYKGCAGDWASCESFGNTRFFGGCPNVPKKPPQEGIG